MGIWNEWSEWSQCKECGDEQYRSRRCSIINSCFGHDREMRECPCGAGDKSNGWSCWSDFTPCSVSCGKGIQKRSRVCLTNNQFDCNGETEQISSCISTNCTIYGKY